MEKEILDVLNELRPEFNYSNSEDFIMDGLLDSFDIISLISILEEKYNIKIDGLDIVPENFASIEKIEELIRKSGGSI